MRRLGLAPRRPTILAPRGEFSSAALGLKPIRKAAYGALARSTGLLADVWLHATSAEEARDMRAAAAGAGGCLVAPNIRALLTPPPHVAAADGVVRLCFLGRISRVKNLDLALRSLARVRAPIVFDIYGPIEDALHWEECRALIAALPPHVAATAHGAIANVATPQMLARHDLLFLPSRSENFGHAIFEALCCGVPALIGDATPWRGLEAAHAGWDLPLDAQAFARAIDAFAAMDATGRARLRNGARALAERRDRESGAVAATRRMFRHALGERPRCEEPECAA
jgi:glycosyltransferase involved in cell wall biosynthesis